MTRPSGKRAAPQQATLGAFFSSKRGRTDGPEKPAGDGIQWRSIRGTWIGTWGTPTAAPKLAAFDLDGTLICVKSKARFPKGADDWRFFCPAVPEVLRRMHQQGYRVVILSNQNGLRAAKGTSELSARARDFRTKVASIARAVDIPLTVVVATEKDYMRKPGPGMWHMVLQLNEDVAVDTASSFFVGDAAGRPAGWKPGVAADFSDSDLAFALNVGVPFYTPEEAFAAEVCALPEPLPLPAPELREIARVPAAQRRGDPAAHAGLLEAIGRHVDEAKQAACGVLAILVGPPACGKSTFARAQLAPLGFERVNMDELKTRKKCTDAVAHALDRRACVVVDNTNPDAAARQPFVALARAAGARCIAVVFAHEPRDLALHNNCFRAQLAQARYLSDARANHPGLDGLPACGDRVPDVAYHSYFKRLQLPAAAEGFDAVLDHAFIPVFDSDTDEQVWNQHF
ncbi:hypothetical protein IWQ57_000517 [Coemansia nantahalensis]|uniref:Uncharacterized protein n=2 Tax=Coemansia TaxID=4863 RepID=A0ACC1K7K4_9FUNG|nr:hypothetical protein IWQ57_000517 [Coemansia nantahalensis]